MSETVQDTAAVPAKRAAPPGATAAAAGSAAGNAAGKAAGDAQPALGVRLEVRGATLGRPGAPALHDLTLAAAPGELLAVVGPSGCGKSTLLRTLAGLLPPLAGEVLQDGAPVTRPGADRALVFQDDALLPWRSLRRNVELPLAVRKEPRAARQAAARLWLERVGLGDRGGSLPHRVSGGQRQRAQLARALAGRPRAVLMDEPFGALDAQTRAGMQNLLVEVLGSTRATVVFVTHDVDEALFLGDRVARLGGPGGLAVHDVPRPRERAAREDPATVALRRSLLAAALPADTAGTAGTAESAESAGPAPADDDLEAP